MSSYLQRQIEARQEAWHAAKSLLDRAASEGRDLSAEEEQSYQRMMACLLYTSPSPRDLSTSRMPSSA